MTRKVTTSIPGMTILDVRKALHTVRVKKFTEYDKVLFNGWTSEDICIRYLFGLHLKRRKK